MTGEMSKSEVTREAFPLYFAAADEVKAALGLDTSVEPFDQYQGPYIWIDGRGRFFLASDDGVLGQWWSERTDCVSYGFFCDCADDVPAEALRDLVEYGGIPREEIPLGEDLARLADIGEAD